jgi:hypothetical protein
MQKPALLIVKPHCTCVPCVLTISTTAATTCCILCRSLACGSLAPPPPPHFGNHWRREFGKEGDSYPKAIVLRDEESVSTIPSPCMYKCITNIYIHDTLDDFCCHPLVTRLTLPKSGFYLVPILYLNLVGHDYISSKHWHVPAIIPHSRIRFWAHILP